VESTHKPLATLKHTQTHTHKASLSITQVRNVKGRRGEKLEFGGGREGEGGEQMMCPPEW